MLGKLRLRQKNGFLIKNQTKHVATKMLYSRGIWLFSPCQMNMLLCLTFSTISTLVRQLSAVFVFCFFNEIFYKAIFTIKVPQTRFW